VAVVWECEVADEKRLDRALRKVIRRATERPLDGTNRRMRQTGHKK
jgi:hypothetical protein